MGEEEKDLGLVGGRERREGWAGRWLEIPRTLLGEGQGEVHGDGAFPHPAFAARDGEDVGDLGEAGAKRGGGGEGGG